MILKYQKFDAQTAPIAGFNMVEASAGTGKTFSISILAIRAILSGIKAEEIIIVTYTKAATNELKQRIKDFIAYALKYSEAQKGKLFCPEKQNKNLEDLCNNFPDKSKLITLLKIACEDYHKLNIFTIHGFCNKLLNEYPIETGQGLNSILISEKIKDDVLLNIVYDFFRKHLYNEDENYLDYLLTELDFLPEKLLSIIKNNLIEYYTYLKTEENSVFSDATDYSAETCNIFYEEVQELKNYVLQNWEAILSGLQDIYDQGAFHKGRFRKERFSKFSNFFKKEAEFTLFSGELQSQLSFLCPNNLKQLSSKNKENILNDFLISSQKTRKWFNSIEEIFELKEKIENLYQEKTDYYFKLLLEYTGSKYQEFKTKNSYFDYSSIICDLYERIKNDKELSLGQEFKAVFIDEFQDTDYWQYEIFKKLFYRSGTVLFFIGDPKQAIYNFRGADLNVYLHAKQELLEHQGTLYTMETNYRSVKNFIEAMNSFYAFCPEPFNYSNVIYHQVKSEKDKCSEGGLYLRYFLTEKQRKNLKDLPGNFSCDFFSESLQKNSISVLLKDVKELIRRNPELSLSEITVLVRNNKQGVEIAKAFENENLKVKNYSATPLYETFEANQLFLLLQALIHNTNELLVNGGGITELVSVNDSDKENFSFLQDKFLKLFRLWETRSLYLMYQNLDNLFNVEIHLARQGNGELKLTNYRELIRDLDAVQKCKRLSCEELLRYFYRRLNSLDDKADLLEKSGLITSDNKEDESGEQAEEAIKIMTIHKSKGLEFPYVFCPFWEGSKKSSKGLKFSYYFDPETKKIKFFTGLQEINSEDQKKIEQEELSEKLRMLYVVITRAAKACYLYASPDTTNFPETLNFLLNKGNSKNDTLSQFYTLHKNLTAGSKYLNWSFCNKEDKDDVADKLKDYHFEAKGINYQKLPEGKHVEIANHLSSYSQIISEAHKSNRVEDHDSSDQIVKDNTEKDSFIINLKESFSPGAETGNIFHNLLENCSREDYLNDENLTKIFNSMAELQNTAESDRLLLKELVFRVYEANILDFKLKDIPHENLYHEMEFYLRVNESSFDFNELFPLKIEIYSGFLHGFIDLLVYNPFNKKYYVIDWKSNYLGDSYSDYSFDNLEKAMTKSGYHLQYLLYCCAWLSKLFVHEYRRKIIPEDRSKLRSFFLQKFGGIAYVYLRGINNETSSRNGIYMKKAADIADIVTDLLIKLQAAQRLLI